MTHDSTARVPAPGNGDPGVLHRVRAGASVRVAVRRVLSLPAILFLRRLVSDATLGLSPTEHAALQAMRVSKRSIYGDRFHEMGTFWKLSPMRLLFLFYQHGWPCSRRLYRSLYSMFAERTVPAELKKAYEDTAFLYSLVLMLSMHRGEWLLPFLDDIRGQFNGRNDVRVLEYGCGVSDMGLLLAEEGYDVVIADLTDRKLEFAEWRYAVRQLPCGVIRVTDTETFPALPGAAFDMIVVSEVLEHVRDPLGLLRLLTMSLRDGGLLFCTAGKALDRKVEGDHLPEAVKIGNSSEYRKYFDSHYSVLAEKPGMPFLFRKTHSEA